MESAARSLRLVKLRDAALDLPRDATDTLRGGGGGKLGLPPSVCLSACLFLRPIYLLQTIASDMSFVMACDTSRFPRTRSDRSLSHFSSEDDMSMSWRTSQSVHERQALATCQALLSLRKASQ